MDRSRVGAIVAAAVALVAAPSAGAATLSYASPTITYTGVDTAEEVHVQSLSATSVRFFGMPVGQITGALPTGCTQLAGRTTDQIVDCDISTLGSVTVSLGGGDDILSETGLSKPSTISGGAGNDMIDGGSQADTVDGNAGTDAINSGPGADTISARDGLVDTINCGNQVDSVVGDSIDRLTGCETQDLQAVDRDGDGYDATVDCDDARADIHPGATDTPGDGIDQDCSGADAKLPTGTGAGGGTGGTTTTTGSGTGGTTTTDTGAGTGVATNNAVVGGSTNTGVTGGSTGTFGVTTTTGNTGITTTDTSTTSTGAAVPRALIIAANPTITFRVLRARRYTRATKISVAPVPAGATVSVSCKGAGCPAKGYKKSFKAGLDHLIVRSVFDLAKLRRGAKLQVRVTKPGVIGRAVRYTVNARTAPDAEASCLAAGTGVRTTC